MNNAEELQPATMEDAKGAFEYLESDEMKESMRRWEEQEKKLLAIYLENPKRKRFFEYDFAEAIWWRFANDYGKLVGDDAIEELKYEILEDERLWEMVYDVVEKYADERGWEMK